MATNDSASASAMAIPADCLDPAMWLDASILQAEHTPHSPGGNCPRCNTPQCCGLDIARQGLATAYGDQVPMSSYWQGLVDVRLRGQVRPLTTVTTDAARVHESLPPYLAAVAAHCGPLAAAGEHGHLLLSGWQPGAGSGRAVFITISAAAEDVRRRRRTHAGPIAAALLAFLGPQADSDPETLVAYPAWLAQWLYAPAGLMITTMAPGQARPDRYGRLVPAPEIILVIVRVGRPDVDTELLGAQAAEELIPAPADDGHDVFTRALGQPIHELAATSAYRELIIAAAQSPAARGTHDR